jgi:hypothetical protein
LLSAERAEIPVVAAHQPVERERRRRPGGEHQARPFTVVDGERLTVAATPDLELPVSAGEGVGVRVEREQHPDVTFCVGPQYHDVAVFRGADIDFRALTTNEAVVGIQPDLDWRIIGTRDGRVCRGPGRR